MSQFHAERKDEVELRSTAEVFSSVRQQADQIGKRFASGGRYTEEQFKAGADVKDGPEPAAEEGGGGEEAKSDAVSTNFDPDDNRTLYDRLKEQRDAKQEEWEPSHQFKNQMDHWRLDEDDAAFEEERVDRLNAQRREAERIARALWVARLKGND